jgi:hypothetical protein
VTIGRFDTIEQAMQADEAFCKNPYVPPGTPFRGLKQLNDGRWEYNGVTYASVVEAARARRTEVDNARQRERRAGALPKRKPNRPPPVEPRRGRGGSGISYDDTVLIDYIALGRRDCVPYGGVSE